MECPDFGKGERPASTINVNRMAKRAKRARGEQRTVLRHTVGAGVVIIRRVSKTAEWSRGGIGGGHGPG